MCRRAGLDSFASKNDGALIELNSEMILEEVVVDKFRRQGDTFAMVRRKVGYNETRFPLLVAIRLYIDFISIAHQSPTMIIKSA